MALEELQDLKGVWAELSKVWEKIEELREKPWLSVAPRKVRQSLDGLLQQLRAFPSRLKQYASFEYVQAMLKGYAKVSHCMVEWKGFSAASLYHCHSRCAYAYIHVCTL